MKLSILDQAPILSGADPRSALLESAKLAQIAEKLGYSRYWIAEHHDLKGLACPAPEVMLGYIGALTKKIRIGSGAILLPHYKPYKVAETFNMLATLFPGRIDLGIGRAPGGSAEAAAALSGNFLKNVWKMPETLQELLHFLHNDFPDDSMFSKVSAAPLPENPPKPWLLGTSHKSSVLAAENGTSYVFGQFMSDKNGADIVKNYQQHFKKNEFSAQPEVIVTVSAFCAETEELAEDLVLSHFIWTLQQETGQNEKGLPAAAKAKKYIMSDEEKNRFASYKNKTVYGNPAQVKNKLLSIAAEYNTDEIMIVTITPTYEERIESYKLIAGEMLSF
ncbi:LLM class flavin-dependent oxidoreductase [Peribacillus deserti]|uniref:LLM class flavin-dependent oxidoreductase n=1 Tax=Peribacillus deserti TaxID=673318 RepID=A0A2N5M8A4_9BACI|nr:LLM class flavin-dependent oxidoreductase [Peribacillus deserti]PLT30611.1 LLM class flavin-dependent oxidoreductase [Peribacillus deserti]